jgi:hypothetical protein
MNGLDALTEGLFDYAGLFPPAALGLEEALRESARAPRLHRPRMVAADLVLTPKELPRITRQGLYFSGFGDTTCTLCLVGVDRNGLAAAVAQAQGFNRTGAPWARITALEAHGDAFSATGFQGLDKARGDLGDVRLFIEPRWPNTAWAGRQPKLMALLARLKESGPAVGLKVRGAGPTAVTKATLARLIPDVTRLGVPFKATQGLHHPILEARYGNSLGFLNLALALRLCQAQGDGLGASDLAALLKESDPAAFDFSDGVEWRDYGLYPDTLERAKRGLPFTIGSCSLGEPDADLVRLFGAP